MPTSSLPEDSLLATLKNGLPSALPQFLVRQRWFGGKARTIRSVQLSDVVPFYYGTLHSYLILAQVEYAGGAAETYSVPLVRVSDVLVQPGNSSLLTVRPEDFTEEIGLKDALTDQQFRACLLEAMAKGVSLRGGRGRVRAVSTPALQALWQSSEGSLTSSLMNAEQSNSSVVYEKRLVLKMFRRLEEGLNPDLEIGSFLTGK